MFSKANLLGALVAAVWAFFGGYLLWGYLAADILSEHAGSATGVMREMPDMFHLVLGCTFVGIAFSILYSKWGGPASGAGSGFTFGFWIGVLIGLGEGLINFSTTYLMDIVGVMINALIAIVFYGIMGVLVGLVYRKLRPVTN